MNLAIVGTRGIPAKYGGYETFAQELSVRLVKLGIKVEVYCDHNDNPANDYNGVILKYLGCTKTSNPLNYYLSSIREAEKRNDFILICGAAGSLFIYSKVFNKKTTYLVNMDGIEYRRAKWSLSKKLFIRFCFWISIKLADYLIADSAGIEKFLSDRYRVKKKRMLKIEYGAYKKEASNPGILREFNLEENSYYLIVSRLEPENNIDNIIKGYLLEPRDYPLIIVGNLLNTSYVEKLLGYRSENVRFLGGIYNQEMLDAVRYYCRAYFHGHSVGGTNPSLLEALGAGNFVIAHDNDFNREVMQNQMFFFRDYIECSMSIDNFEKLPSGMISEARHYAMNRISQYYNWDRIAEEYFNFLSVNSKL